jgi:alkaline phosphatase
MVASVPNRRDEAGIAAQMLASGAEVMLGGGEGWFLPQGTRGRHGQGLRTDGRNLIEEARRAGYTIVFTAAELAAAPATGKLLGLFAHTDTFNEGDREAVRRAGGLLKAGAPDWDVMIAAALQRLKAGPKGYLLVANHEATDDLGGENASAALTAAAAADRAIGLAIAEAARDPKLTVVVASDSDSGAMVATDAAARGPSVPADIPGARLEGDAEGRPFLAAPDRSGRRLPFTIAWGVPGDVAGGLVARGTGPGARLIKGTVDSTDIYRALHFGLFGPPR